MYYYNAIYLITELFKYFTFVDKSSELQKLSIR